MSWFCSFLIIARLFIQTSYFSVLFMIFLSYFFFSRQASHDSSFRCHGDAAMTSHVASLWKWSGFYLLMKREHVDGIHKISRVFMFVWMLNLRSTNWVKASYCYYATPFPWPQVELHFTPRRCLATTTSRADDLFISPISGLSWGCKWWRLISWHAEI